MQLISSILILTALLGMPSAHMLSDSTVSLVDRLHETYQNYKIQQYDACNQMMTQLDFTPLKSSVSNSGAQVIDSLVFSNDAKGKWALFRSVDLGYMRVLDVTLAFEHAEGEELIAYLAGVLSKNKPQYDLEITEEAEAVEIVLTDKTEVWVGDDRFKEKTYTLHKNLFQCTMTSSGGYVLIDIREILPLEFYTNSDYQTLSKR